MPKSLRPGNRADAAQVACGANATAARHPPDVLPGDGYLRDGYLRDGYPSDGYAPYVAASMPTARSTMRSRVWPGSFASAASVRASRPTR